MGLERFFSSQRYRRRGKSEKREDIRAATHMQKLILTLSESETGLKVRLQSVAKRKA